MLELKENNTFVLPESIFLQKIPELGKYWVFNIDNGEHYSLNETSYWILEQIAEGLSIKNIISNFLNHFEVDENNGKTDFNKIVNNFLEENIIMKKEELR